MNRLRVWGLSAALVAGAGGLAIAGDPNMGPDQTTLVQKISNMFAPKPSKPLGPSGQASPPTITAPLTHEVLAKCLQAEDMALLRRLDVCDALRRVADEKGDPALNRQADEFERQARSVYDARVTALGVPKYKRPVPESTNVVALEEPAPPKVAANRLTAPASPTPVETTAEIREVKP
jgi:hypothetical protein